MRTDFALRLPGWARFVPPEDHWVVLCADAAYNPFELRDEAKAWRVAHADPAELSPEVPWCRAGLDMEKHRILRLDPPSHRPTPTSAASGTGLGTTHLVQLGNRAVNRCERLAARVAQAAPDGPTPFRSRCPRSRRSPAR